MCPHKSSTVARNDTEAGVVVRKVTDRSQKAIPQIISRAGPDKRIVNCCPSSRHWPSYSMILKTCTAGMVSHSLSEVVPAST